ncbi:hypothetical protein JZ751_019163 [Albula glossodonta]|uniref:Uncharacterized protein n=1 Tax=Albula glossodonta TaxID=121402 RepID=A0A8T2MSS2_9TELE|nr:hypothetical protein JZ751_019163 [Albula glossodonta]
MQPPIGHAPLLATPHSHSHCRLPSTFLRCLIVGLRLLTSSGTMTSFTETPTSEDNRKTTTTT